MQQALYILQTLAPHSVKGWLIVLDSGIAVSVILQVIKHFGKLADAKKTVTFLLGMLSLVASYADMYLAYAHQHTDVLQAVNMGWILTAAIFVHRFAVSPIYSGIVNFLNGVYADAMAYRKDQAAVQAATQTVIAPSTEPQFTLPSQMA